MYDGTGVHDHGLLGCGMVGIHPLLQRPPVRAAATDPVEGSVVFEKRDRMTGSTSFVDKRVGVLQTRLYM